MAWLGCVLVVVVDMFLHFIVCVVFFVLLLRILPLDSRVLAWLSFLAIRIRLAGDY